MKAQPELTCGKTYIPTAEANNMAFIRIVEGAGSIPVIIGTGHVFPFPALTLIHLCPGFVSPVFTVFTDGNREIISADLCKIKDFKIILYLSKVKDNLFVSAA